MKTAMSTTRERYDALRALGLKLDLTRGQPGDDDFDISNAMLTIVDDKSLVTPSGVALRNYPGGIAGLQGGARAVRARCWAWRPTRSSWATTPACRSKARC